MNTVSLTPRTVLGIAGGAALIAGALGPCTPAGNALALRGAAARPKAGLPHPQRHRPASCIATRRQWLVSHARG
jgi:hypothetical protein